MSGASQIPPPVAVREGHAAGLSYRRWGSGPVRWVALHGWGGDRRTFDALAPRLLGRRGAAGSVVAFDLPGYGHSPAPARGARVSLEDIARRVARAIEALSGGGSVSLLGTCSGAVMALLVQRFTTVAPHRLVLCEPFAFVPAYLRLFTWPLLGPLFYGVTFANPIGRWITDRLVAPRRGRHGEAAPAVSFGTTTTRTAVAYLRALDDIPGPESLAAVRAPVSLLWGAQTFGAVKRSVGRWRACWPTAAAIELADAGHLMVEERPGPVAEHILEGEAASDRARGRGRVPGGTSGERG